jgi:hypothetical protein
MAAILLSPEFKFRVCVTSNPARNSGNSPTFLTSTVTSCCSAFPILLASFRDGNFRKFGHSASLGRFPPMFHLLPLSICGDFSRSFVGSPFLRIALNFNLQAILPRNF